MTNHHLKNCSFFQISVKESELVDLKRQLEWDSQHLASPVEGTNFNYGFNTDYLKEDLIPYWKDSYNWRATEKKMNALGNFKTTIDGLDIHFVHVKPSPEAAQGKTVIPLLLVHGWPGSFMEFEKIIPILTKPRPGFDFVFEVVAPSIPGNCNMNSFLL